MCVPHPKIFRISSKPMICPNPPRLPLFPGVLPSKASFSMHSILVNHFLQGAWYPKGGAGEIAFHTIPVIRKAGGNVFGKAPVQRILLDAQGRACGEHWPGTGCGAAPQSGLPFTCTSFFSWIFPPRRECQKRPRFGGYICSRDHFGCWDLQYLREAVAGSGAGSAGYRVSTGLPAGLRR